MKRKTKNEFEKWFQKENLTGKMKICLFFIKHISTFLEEGEEDRL
jgi:hypothetical protein